MCYRELQKTFGMDATNENAAAESNNVEKTVSPSRQRWHGLGLGPARDDRFSALVWQGRGLRIRLRCHGRRRAARRVGPCLAAAAAAIVLGVVRTATSAGRVLAALREVVVLTAAAG